MFNGIATVLRRVRSRLTNLSDEKVLEELSRELTEGNLGPMKLLERLSKMPVVNMAVFEKGNG